MTVGIKNTAKAAASFWFLAFLSSFHVIAFHPSAIRSPAWTHLKSRPQCRSAGLQSGTDLRASHGGDSLGLDSSQIASGDLLMAKATTALPEVPSMSENNLPGTSDSSNHMREVIQKVVDSWQQGYQETVGSIHNPPRSPGSAPTLAQYIREGRFHPEETINRVRNLKGLNVDNFVQELGRIQQSVLQGIDAEGKGMEKVSQLLQKIPVEKMAQSIQNFVLALQTPSEDTVQNSLKALDLDELGGWYVGSLGVLWFISQSSISMSSKKNLEQKLNEATEVIDKEAKVAEQKVQSLLTEKERMENQVKELSKATVTVAEELKELKLEKASRDYAVAEMKSELRSLKNELKSRQLKEKEVAAQLTKAEIKLKAETLKLQRELEERRAKEEALQQRIMELQAQLGTNSGAASLEEPTVTTKSSKTTKSRKSSTKIDKADVVVPEPVFEPVAEPQGVFFASVEELAVSKPPVASPAKATRKKTAKAAKEVAKPDVEAISEPANAAKAVAKPIAEAISEPSPKSTKAATSKGTKKATSKSASVKKPTKVAEDPPTKIAEEPPMDLPGLDWSKLTPAAVRRKSISELSDYLLAKGATVKDEKGKPLKKADLLEKVLSTL